MLLAEADAIKGILHDYVRDLRDKSEAAGNVQKAPDEAVASTEEEDEPQPGVADDEDELIF